MPTFTGARLPAAREQETGERTGEHELRFDRHAYAVSAAAAMEDLLATGTEPGHEMLEVGHRRRGSAEHGGVEGPAPRREQCERDEAAADFEAPVRDVLVRHPIAGDVQRRPEEQRERARANQGSHRGSRRNVQRDDHTYIFANRAS